MKHTLSVIVDNKPGVLARISGLFSRRGFNIESLAVGPTEDPAVSRMTIVVDGATHPLEQITKQLHKLITVIKIYDLGSPESVERELALIKVHADHAVRADVIQVADIFRVKVIDVSPSTLTIEATGTKDKVEAIIELLRPYGIKELARTGTVALSRGGHQI